MSNTNKKDNIVASSPFGRFDTVNTFHLEETDSTNTYLKNLLLKQEVEEQTIVVSDFQTAGKGQRGNYWESQKGENLLFSIVLFPNFIKANEQFIISQCVSLAIKDYLDTLAEHITIKWPNDIYWKDKKICGILIENSLTENKINQSIIGIGININQTKWISNAPNPISLKQITNKDYDILKILESIKNTILTYYSEIKHGNKEQIIKRYKDALFRNKGYYSYNDGVTDFLACIKNIEPTGILVLETDGGTERRFAFKEVKYQL